MRVEVLIPAMRKGFGGFTLDPVAAVLGGSLESLLGSLVEGRIAQDVVLDGVPGKVDIVPLALPPGAGVSFPIRAAQGDLGFYNRDGHLVLIVPNMAAGWVMQGLREDLAAGRAYGPHVVASERQGLNAEFAIAVVPGLDKRVQILGNVTIGVRGRG